MMQFGIFLESSIGKHLVKSFKTAKAFVVSALLFSYYF